MQHITSTSGLSAQAPVPSVTKKTTITRIGWVSKKSGKKQHGCSNHTQKTLHYIHNGKQKLKNK